MFLRDDHGLELAGGTTARTFGRAAIVVAPPSRGERWRDTIAQIDWTPDLGARIGTLDWWRGAATCLALCAATYALAPGRPQPLLDVAAPPLSGAEWDQARGTGIAPIAWGATSGVHAAATDLVQPLTTTPERPRVDLQATLGEGDSFAAVLRRAGVGAADADRAAALVGSAVPVAGIAPGTQIEMTLGRRADRTQPRPLEAMHLRASFDLALSLTRAGTGLTMTRQPIAIDHTPLRIQGLVGAGLYRSMRAAGAPAKAVETYIRALATRLSIGGDVNPGDSFDIAIGQARAATGEVELGDVLFVGLDQAGGRRTQLMHWGEGQSAQWYDANGRFERQGAIGLPVAGHVTSNFGLRFHPILHILRMHKGVDIGAAWGSPVHAAMDGVVAIAGQAGGYGNLVRINHSNSLQTGYGHLSRIMVRPGERVQRGEVIGLSGSSGLSTGPHLHWEVARNGVLVNPLSITFASMETLSGDDLRRFRAQVSAILAVRPGGAH